MKFEELLKEYLEEKRRNEDEFLKKEKNNFHCSESGRCLRFAFFERMDPLKEQGTTQKIFMLGHMYHEFVQKNILTGYKIEEKFMLELPEFTISGMIDAYNKDRVIELKTTSNVWYVREPKEEHITQATLYLHYTNLPVANIVYINKNDFETKEFEVNYNKTLYNQVISDFEYLNQKIKEGAKPLDVEPKIGVECYRCKYTKRCFTRKK